MFILLGFFCLCLLEAQSVDYSKIWYSKTAQEKLNYVQGLIDASYDVCMRIDMSIVKAENEKKISSNLGDEIESPIYPYLFMYGNVKTNKTESLVKYLDDIYKIKEFKEFSPLLLLYSKAKEEYDKKNDV